jgi:hypothetical protein
MDSRPLIPVARKLFGEICQTDKKKYRDAICVAENVVPDV